MEEGGEGRGGREGGGERGRRGGWGEEKGKNVNKNNKVTITMYTLIITLNVNG